MVLAQRTMGDAGLYALQKEFWTRRNLAAAANDVEGVRATSAR